MTNYLKQRLESAALKAEKEQEYWDREYSGDIELGRAKLEIKELKQQLDAQNQLKSISWNLNRIANVLEEIVPNNKTAGERILNSIRKGGR